MNTPTPPLPSAVVAIREALAAFPKGWVTVFQEVREREPGVVEIGPPWEDSDDLAQVIRVDTGNYYDNAAAMPMARYIAAMNPVAITALLERIAALEADARRPFKLRDALYELLEDTQHKEHADCEDGGYCPVRDARAALEEFDAALANERAGGGEKL